MKRRSWLLRPCSSTDCVLADLGIRVRPARDVFELASEQ